MSDIQVVIVHGDPIMDKMPTLRERFKWQASALWARGMPPPTADEIADVMMRVVGEAEQ